MFLEQKNISWVAGARMSTFLTCWRIYQGNPVKAEDLLLLFDCYPHHQQGPELLL